MKTNKWQIKGWGSGKLQIKYFVGGESIWEKILEGNLVRCIDRLKSLLAVWPKNFAFLLFRIYPKIGQSCLTFLQVELTGSSINRIFQARTLERVTISFSRGSSWPRKLNPGVLPTPVFLPAEIHGQWSLAGYIYGVPKSWTQRATELMFLLEPRKLSVI